MVNPLAQDLEHILAHTEGLWEELRSQRIFITGGTGFFGCWLLESFVWANDKLKLNAEALVLTRNLDAFSKKAPHLVSHPAIKFHLGDVRSFEFPTGTFSHVIHAATEANGNLNQEDPLLMMDAIAQGTKHSLEFAKHCGAKKFLLTSSGAVYGKQPEAIAHLPEDYQGAPNIMEPKSAYGEGKRWAELLCSVYAHKYKIDTKIARCFAFVGPSLPLDTHFAIGNFIQDALNDVPIKVQGDGTPYRSYLYASDLAIWLWTILFRGESCHPYNVGSEFALTLSDLAKVIADLFLTNAEIKIAKNVIPGKPIERYIPSTKRAFQELQLQQTINLSEALQRSVVWYSQRGDNHAII